MEISDFNNRDVLRKYISIPKLIFLLQNKKLFFCRADYFKCYKPSLFSRDGDMFSFFYGEKKVLKENFKNNLFSYLINTNELAKYMFINSWNCQKTESFAMWRLFLRKYNECVAMQTTIEKLNNSFQSEINLTLKKVEYENIEIWGSMYKLKSDILSPFYVKDVFYEFETEARIVLSTYEQTFPNSHVEPVMNDNNELCGVYIPTDFSVIIDKIIVFPNAEDFIFNSIKNFVNLNLPSCPVLKSELDVKDGGINEG
ncbi:MAG: hypothetical protein V1779_07335 [bacterium]